MSSTRQNKGSTNKKKTTAQENNPFVKAITENNHSQIPSLAKTYDINMANPPLYKTALHSAVITNNVEGVRILLQNGANPNAKTKAAVKFLSGNTPLHDAASTGNIEIINLLLEHKADIEAIDESGFSPLQHATFVNPKIKTVRHLLEKGANPNYVNVQRNQKASQMALEDNEPEIATLLQQAEKEYKLGAPSHSSTQKNEAKKEEIFSFANIVRELTRHSPAPLPAQQMVDLHGSSVNDASETVKHYINTADHSHTQNIRFVTGRGNHINSRGMRGTLYKEFPNWITDENLQSKISEVKQENGFYEISLHTKEPKQQNNPLEKLSLEWLKNHKAEINQDAERGDHLAEYFKGYCALYGINDEANLKTAVTYIQKAADGGLPCAKHELGGLYWHGKGVKQSDETAIKLFHEAATLNFPWAHNQLGDIYYYGHGTENNTEKAMYHYDQAGKLGLNTAYRKKASLYLHNGSHNDIQQAFTIYKDLADKYSDSLACYNTAHFLYHGKGCAQDFKASFTYAMKAAKGNDPDANMLLYTMYNQGIGTTKNSKLALEFLKRSANLKFKHALFELYLHPSTASSERKDYLKRAAMAEHIIAQAIILSDKSFALTEQENDFIKTSFCAQDIDEIIEIANAERLKIITIEAYIKLTCIQGKEKFAEALINKLKETADPTFPHACLYFGMTLIKNSNDDSHRKAIDFITIAAQLGHPIAQKVLIENTYLTSRKASFAK